MQCQCFKILRKIFEKEWEENNKEIIKANEKEKAYYWFLTGQTTFINKNETKGTL